jgi:hypothetical protein
MSQDTQRNDISKRVVVYRIPGMDAVAARRDVEYRATDTGILTMDIYYPPGPRGETRIPAVVFVAGYPDAGFQRMLGCRFKEMGSSVSWGQLTAVSGMAAITYTSQEPATDLHALLEHIRHNAAELGIDENRIGLWACSGNVPNALFALMREGGDYLKCAVLCYGIMLDLKGSAIVAEAARTWGFVNPAAGKSVDDLPKGTPLFIVRAGRDEFPRLNETIDQFLVEGLSRNLPITFVNHAAAPHAFDLTLDSETSREIIRQMLAFMRFHLGGRVPRETEGHESAHEPRGD